MLSAVIPVYNEDQSLELLHAELSELAGERGYDLEIIFVDDGSTDGSWDVIRRLADRDPRVRGVRFRRNFGKAPAIDAGFRLARGEQIVTLDADLQDNPHEIPRLRAALEAGLDLVSGWKKVRYDPWHKVLPSRVFNWLVSAVTRVRLHDHNCGMKCFRREVVRELKLYGELHRFIPVMASARGFRVGEVVVHHRPRRFGVSKYGVRRFTRGLIDLGTVSFLTRYGQRPNHFFGTLGMGFACLAALAMVLALWGAFGIAIPGWWFVRPLWSLLGSLALVGMAANLFAAGLLAELLVANRVPATRAYSVAEVTFSVGDPSAMKEGLADPALAIDWPTIGDPMPRQQVPGLKLP